MPGETAAPGTATGKTGTPGSHAAGSAFSVTVNAVDANWNPVSSTDTVAITSSDGQANLPANAALVAGTKTFSVTLKTTGSRTVTASDSTNGAKSPNTSPAVTVTSAPTVPALGSPAERRERQLADADAVRDVLEPGSDDDRQGHLPALLGQ